MVDVASIVVAVIGLVGGLGAAAFTGWWTYYSGERTRLIDAQKLVDKYSDPILLAAQDLQERLYNILITKPVPKQPPTGTAADRDSEHDSQRYSFSDIHPPESPQRRAIRDTPENENLLLYTAFLVGQYFSWTSIMRRKAQFLKFSTSDKNKKLVLAFRNITEAFTPANEANDPLSKPFSLPRSNQGAIGERMVHGYDSEEPICIGYATFYRLWNHEDEEDPFRQFFSPITDGITEVYKARQSGYKSVPDHRLRRLQHLFVDLVNILDDKHVWPDRKYCHRNGPCPCEKCNGGKEPCPCGACPDTTKPQEVRQPPLRSQTPDLEAAVGHGEQQNGMSLVVAVNPEAGKLQEQQQVQEEQQQAQEEQQQAQEEPIANEILPYNPAGKQRLLLG
jgi:hypothetical protein